MEMEDVFREHQTALYAFFLRVVGNRADDHDLRLDLEREFSALPVADRDTLMLVDFLVFSPAEAAALTEIDPSVFRMRLHRARRLLRDRMEVLSHDR